ncbi:MAG: class I SAM-dependent methyltransferase [Bacteroidota bacterium]
MSLSQHTSLDVRTEQQIANAENYLLPFLDTAGGIQAGHYVMEIGCGEGGVLHPVIAKGARVLGVDLNDRRIQYARERFADHIATGKADFVTQNVYDESFLETYRGQFDWIMLKDTIEHIPEQEKFIPYILQLLKPGGKIFFGFPPWRMPFGGHQQICQHKLLSKLPYVHLLPRPIYRGIISAFGEREAVKKELLELKDSGISIGRFERIARQTGLEILARNLYLFNPIYKYKFGLEARKQAAWLVGLPWVRDFFTTCAWYVVGKSRPKQG